MKIKTPLPVTILVVTVLIFTSWYGLRLYETIVYWEILLKYNSQPGPFYMVFFSMIWLILGLLIIVGIYKGKSNHWSLIIKSIIFLFFIWYWIDRLIFQKTQTTYFLQLVITGLMLLFILILLNLKHTQNYFKQRETHDR